MFFKNFLKKVDKKSKKVLTIINQFDNIVTTKVDKTSTKKGGNNEKV